MMDELVSRLLENGLYLSREGNKLNIEYNGNSISDELLEEIRNNKEELLRYLSAEDSSQDYKDIVSIKTPGPFELSNAQRRLWVLSQFEGGSVAYNMPHTNSLEQDVDIDSFKRAIDSVIERHEILRTVFREDETGEIKQWVLKSGEMGFEIDYKDLRKEEKKQEKVQEYIEADSYMPFDMEMGPLLRAALLRVEEERYVFYYNMHHIISDGWSMDILTRDVFTYYEAFKENTIPRLKPLRIQYKDYSAWQLAQLQEESFKSHKDYWLNSLSGELPVLNLPSTKQRPRIKTNNGYALSTYIDSITTGKLKKYSQDNGGSLFMGLLASWNVLMYRYTSQTDIIIGTPVAGREHADLEDQIGFYVNTLALRNEITPGESFTSFYKKLKDNTLRSYNHQMYPFDNLVEELDIKGDTSRSAIFDVMLMLLNTGEKVENLGSISNEIKEEELNCIVDLGYSASKFDIDLSVQEIDDYISLHLVYNSDVYEREMVEGLLNHYKQLLQALLENPEEKIGQIDFLSKKEKHELLFTFNDTGVVYPKDKTIADLFEEQVKSVPGKIAVAFEEKELTYKELEERSNQLANYLQKNYDLNQDDLVGIKLDRSEWMIISILGVLKSGGAYVPIDPDYPQDRIDYIENDTKCKACIDKKELSKFRDGEEKYSKQKPTSLTKSNNLAYVMYTSGSTGKPKGVMIEQKSVVRLVKNTNFIDLIPGDNVLGLSNFSFDGSTFDIFMPLLNGGKLVISSRDIFLSMEKLNGIIKDQSVQSFFLTTVLFNSLVDSGSDSLTKLKYVLFGGEKVSVKHVTKFKELYPKVNLYHVYGPTENTTFSTWYAIDCVNEGALTIPIGSGISNSTVYVLDENQKLAPIGVTGEIYVGGPGLARGYLNHEELTVEKFIANPFKAGERLYKTGDLGRWTSDGNIEFIGRKDDQVKIRGFRIEFGEIEHALQSHIAIEEAVVMVWENQNSEKELVAYITSKEEQNINELRSYLKELLPDYMLPAYYVQLESMPLTRNGKIDKKALPDPNGLGLASGVEYVAPRNETEEQLVKIWQEVLQRKNIGVRDDFFALGGHSLKAVRLSNEYQKQLGVKLSLKDLFANISIESHAELINLRNWVKEQDQGTLENENIKTFNF